MYVNRFDRRRSFLGRSAATLALGSLATMKSYAQGSRTDTLPPLHPTHTALLADQPHVTAPAIDFEPGGYRYLPDVFQYSGGVASLRGYAMVRVRLRKMVTLQDGYQLIEAHLKSVGRPTTALCSMELRSPRPFTEEGFKAFNSVYVKTLERWGLYKDGKNPVARNNVCPEKNKPAETRLFAFTYTVKSQPGDVQGFQIAGSAEEPESIHTRATPHIVAPGDISPEGILAKAKWVIEEMQLRLKGLDLVGSPPRRRTCTRCTTSIR